MLLDRRSLFPGDRWQIWREREEGTARYAEAQQSPGSDTLTDAIWKRLAADALPVLSNYTISEKDVSGPFLRKLYPQDGGHEGYPKAKLHEGRRALAEEIPHELSNYSAH